MLEAENTVCPHHEHTAIGRDISERGQDWLNFSLKVLKHIENYAVPQYGDKGKDQFTKWSAEMCRWTAEKYQNRAGKQQREGEELLDIIKQVHCLQVTHDKIKGEKDDAENS